MDLPTIDDDVSAADEGTDAGINVRPSPAEPPGGGGGEDAGMPGGPTGMGTDGAQDSAGQDGTRDGGAAPMAQEGAEDPECDLNGIWIAQQITVSEALQLPQSSNNYFYLELAQAGTSFEVVEHFDCGIEVRGSAVVLLGRPALAAQIAHNRQVGRRGTMRRVGDTCAFEAERFWSVRGADEGRFSPAGTPLAEASVAMVAAQHPLPTRAAPDGAIDPDGDGKLGLAFEVSGLIAGTRNSVQRDWSRWFSEPGYEITPSLGWQEQLVVRADFDNEEHVLDPASGLLTSLSSPSAGAKHELRLRFLGRDSSDPRVSEIVMMDPVDTCYAIQDAMPPEALE